MTATSHVTFTKTVTQALPGLSFSYSRRAELCVAASRAPPPGHRGPLRHIARSELLDALSPSETLCCPLGVEIDGASACTTAYLIARPQLKEIHSAAKEPDPRFGDDRVFDREFHREIQRSTATGHHNRAWLTRIRVIGLLDRDICRVPHRAVRPDCRQKSGDALSVRRIRRRTNASVHHGKVAVLNLSPSPLHIFPNPQL